MELYNFKTNKQTNKQTNRKPTATSSNTSFIQRRYTYDVHKNYLIFKTLHPLVHLRPKSFHPLDLGCPTSNESLPLPATLSNRLWNSNRTVHVNERIQNKSKTKSRRIQIDHVSYCSI